jgi:hypothetical protein
VKDLAWTVTIAEAEYISAHARSFGTEVPQDDAAVRVEFKLSYQDLGEKLDTHGG